MYYKLDNHWNYRAGYLTTQLLLSRIKKDFPGREIPKIPSYTWRDTLEKSGIHYVVLGMKNKGERRFYPTCLNPRSIENVKYKFPCPEGFTAPWDFERRFTIKEDSTGLTILFIRDSFGQQIITFVRVLFQESVFIFDAWQYKLKPDIVVFLTLDSNLEAVIGKLLKRPVLAVIC